MPQPRLILASAAVALAAAALSGCGQTGALYLPQLPKGVERATLPQSFFGSLRAEPASAVPAATPAALEGTASAPQPVLFPDDEDFEGDNISVPIILP